MALFGGDDDFDEDEEEEIELVLFQGALNGKKANMKANARLVQAGLMPAKEIVTDGIARRAETCKSTWRTVYCEKGMSMTATC